MTMEITSYYSSYASGYTNFARKTDCVNKTETTVEKLETFKKEIWNQINSFPWNQSISESIQITEGAFQRMMEDSDFKDRMLDVLYKDAVAGRPPICAGITWIDESGYRGFSYNDKEAGNIAFQAHSNHKDSFYVRKAKSLNVAELWKEKLQERELQQKLRDEEYFQDKRLAEGWNKRPVIL